MSKEPPVAVESSLYNSWAGWVLCTPRVKSASSSRLERAGVERIVNYSKTRDHICQSLFGKTLKKERPRPERHFPWLKISSRYAFPSVSPPISPSRSRQCLRLLRLLRSACPPSPARARARARKSSSTSSMRNRHPPIPPNCTLAAHRAPTDPEAPFLHPTVHLKPDPLSPALNHTPPPQRSLMPNRKQKSPPEPKSPPLRRTRNRRQSLIVPAQSSLVGDASSDASLASDGGSAWDAEPKTRMTSYQRQIVHPLRLPFFPSIPEEKFHPPSCQMTSRHRPVTCLGARKPPILRS